MTARAQNSEEYFNESQSVDSKLIWCEKLNHLFTAGLRMLAEYKIHSVSKIAHITRLYTFLLYNVFRLCLQCSCNMIIFNILATEQPQSKPFKSVLQSFFQDHVHPQQEQRNNVWFLCIMETIVQKNKVLWDQYRGFLFVWGQVCTGMVLV